MGNVVPFERPKRPQVQGWLELTAFIDPNAKLEEGDLIACCFRNSDQIMFWVWYGPTGRDSEGRFCKHGDPRATFDTDHFHYSTKCIRDGHFTILGKLLVGLGPAEPVLP